MDNRLAMEIWRQIQVSSLCQLKNDLVKKALEYSHIRAECFLLTMAERAERDSRRTAAHNAFIDSCNILSRNMASKGESIKWRELLGEDRKSIGDFACWLHALMAIQMR